MFALSSLPSFMTEWWFFVIGIVVLLGLIGLLMVLRNQRKDEE